MSVATEMVKELEITEWEASEIAEMIEEEIASLVPAWKNQSLPFNYNRQESFTCKEDDGDEAEDAIHYPFYASSSHSSSQVSLPAFTGHNSCHDVALLRDQIIGSSSQHWLQGMFLSYSKDNQDMLLD